MELGIQSTAGATLALAPQTDTLVALSLIDESPINPRKTFNQAKLQELADSIRSVGIIEPIVVRPAPAMNEATPHRWQIVAGARRFRAGKLAGLREVPIRVVFMTDVQVREAQLIENDQREDVGEIERAEGYRALMTECKLTAPEIAKRIGQSVETVYARLKILNGTPEVQAALSKGTITAAHAVLIARFPAPQQKKALEYALGVDLTRHGVEGEAVSVRDLDDWLDDNVRLKLGDAPFSLEDKILVPAAGSCRDCPKRDPKSCFDPGCYKTKVGAFLDAKRAAASKKLNGAPLLELSWSYGGKGKPKGVLNRNQYDLAGDAVGPKIKTGLMLDGPDAGKTFKVKLREARKPEPQRDWNAENRKREEQRERERIVRRAIFDACCERVKAPLERVDLEFVVEALIDATNGHGVPDIDVAKLKPQALAHLLIELSISGDLSGWPNHKPERLLALAKRCKVNVDAVRKRAEAELEAAAEVQTTATTEKAGDATSPQPASDKRKDVKIGGKPLYAKAGAK